MWQFPGAWDEDTPLWYILGFLALGCQHNTYAGLIPSPGN